MKKILSIIFLAMAIIAQGQDSEYTMYRILSINPDNRNLQKLNENLKTHNDKFHNSGAFIAVVWSVSSGPNVGQLIWMMGPLTFADLDNPLGIDHDKHWNNSVMPYVKSLGTLEYWKRNDEISNIEGDPKSKVYIRTLKVNKGQGDRVNDYFAKTRDVLKVIEGENPWSVYSNEFRQGNLGRHFATVRGFNKWAWIDKDIKFKEKFLEVHGENSWESFLNMYNEIFEDSYDEIWILLPGLAGSKL